MVKYKHIKYLKLCITYFGSRQKSFIILATQKTLKESDVNIELQTSLANVVGDDDVDVENDVDIERQTMLKESAQIANHVKDTNDVSDAGDTNDVSDAGDTNYVRDADDVSDTSISKRRQLTIPRCNCTKWIVPSHTR